MFSGHCFKKADNFVGFLKNMMVSSRVFILFGFLKMDNGIQFFGVYPFSKEQIILAEFGSLSSCMKEKRHSYCKIHFLSSLPSNIFPYRSRSASYFHWTKKKTHTR